MYMCMLTSVNDKLSIKRQSRMQVFNLDSDYWIYRHWFLFIHINCFSEIFRIFLINSKVVKLWLQLPIIMIIRMIWTLIVYNCYSILYNSMVINLRNRKLLDSQIDLQQPQTSQTVNNTNTDMMLISGKLEPKWRHLYNYNKWYPKRSYICGNWRRRVWPITFISSKTSCFRKGMWKIFNVYSAGRCFLFYS